MRRLAHTIALAIALSAVPACAVLTPPAGVTQSAQTPGQRAYVLIGAYALALDEATLLARDPQTPKAVKTALGKAEAAATPAIELVKAAAVAFQRAQDGAGAAALSQAIGDAQAPVAALSALVAKTK